MAPYSSISKILFTFTIGFPFIFLLISIQVDAFRAYVNTQGPKPQVWFILEPPNVVIAAPVKNKPVYLPCHATVELEKTALRNLQCGDSDQPFDIEFEESDKAPPIFLGGGGDDEDELEEPENDQERIDRIKDAYLKQQARTHFNDLKSDDDTVQNVAHPFGPAGLDNFEEEDDDNEGEDLMFGARARPRRNVNRPQEFPRLEYVWYRNGEPLLTTSDTTSTLNGFRLSPNGTLRIQYSNLTSGVYRCMANETRCGIGSVLSKNVVVKVALLERDSISNNSHNNVAIKGGSIVLNCPFKSYPAAKFSWYFNKLNEVSTSTTTEQTTTVTSDNTAVPTMPIRLVSTATPIVQNKDNRYFLLNNGSLLITSLTANDTGRYKCDAFNEYIPKKNQRTAWVMLKVEEPSNTEVVRFGLLPSLQPQNMSVLSHDTLRLHCASYSEKITWSFTPRGSNIPIQLTDFTNELKYVNASIDKHDGVYNCSTPSAEYQIFNVTVTSPPVLAETLDSRTTSVATGVIFNCSATGNPPPVVTWYRNGRIIENNYVTNYDAPILRINSVEPEDQGIYECFARNSVGEVKSSGHLTVRKKQQYKDLTARPMNVKCYPADFNNVIITYESKHLYHMINYYVATKNPFTWQSPPPLEPLTPTSIKITTYIEPLKKYGVYLRGIIRKEAGKGITKTDQAMISLTRMSDLVECATQGIPVRYTSMSNTKSIFIWWADTLKHNLTSMIIQFLHNDTMNPPLFGPEIIGSYSNFVGSNNYLTYSEFNSTLEKIPAETKIADAHHRRRRYNDDIYMKISRLATRNAIYPNNNEGMISEVKLYGNVTGILIPNSQRIIVRVLASTEPDGNLFPQDLKFVPWTTVELDEATPKAKLKIVEANARNLRIEWTPLEENSLPNNCMEVCYKDMIHDFMQRGGRTIDCRKIDSSANEGVVDKLSPFTSYKIFIRACNNTQPLSEVLDIRTKQDVPGIISRQNISKEEDGIVLSWEPPAHPNGALLYYLIEWTKDGQDFASNVSIDGPFLFKFPNTSATDKFNMSIKAVSNAGEGIPILIDLRKQSIFEFPYDFTTDDSILGIALGIFLSIFCIIICIWIFVRNRNCNKNHQQNHQNGNNNHTLTSSGGQNTLNCTADVHEMQTLITHHDVSTIVANGTVQRFTRPDLTEVDSIRTLSNEKPKLLKTSPKLNVRTIEGGQAFELEPLHSRSDMMPNGGTMTTFQPTKNGNGSLPIGNGLEKPKNGMIANPYQLKTVSAMTNGSCYQDLATKVNGNLRITENPQYLKPALDTSPLTSTVNQMNNSPPSSTFLPFDGQLASSTPNNSILDSSHQQLLANSNSDTQETNRSNKRNNSNNLINNIIKIDDKIKTSTLKHLNNDQLLQQQLDDISYDLNTSNLSTKSLTGTSTSPKKINGNTNWLDSYRQPIVGPNG